MAGGWFRVGVGGLGASNIDLRIVFDMIHLLGNCEEVTIHNWDGHNICRHMLHGGGSGGGM